MSNTNSFRGAATALRQEATLPRNAPYAEAFIQSAVHLEETADIEDFIHNSDPTSDLPGVEWDETGRTVTDRAALLAHIRSNS